MGSDHAAWVQQSFDEEYLDTSGKDDQHHFDYLIAHVSLGVKRYVVGDLLVNHEVLFHH